MAEIQFWWDVLAGNKQSLNIGELQMLIEIKSISCLKHVHHLYQIPYLEMIFCETWAQFEQHEEQTPVTEVLAQKLYKTTNYLISHK